MGFHTLQSTHYGGAELCDSCEDSAPGVSASHPPMEFHTLQTIHYEGAELCDSCQDSATRVYASHPPMEFHEVCSNYVEVYCMLSLITPSGVYSMWSLFYVESTLCEVYSM